MELTQMENLLFKLIKTSQLRKLELKISEKCFVNLFAEMIKFLARVKLQKEILNSFVITKMKKLTIWAAEFRDKDVLKFQ